MEFQLLFSISNYSFLQIDEIEMANLHNHFTTNSPAQIYFILAKNRIKINNEFVEFNKKNIMLEFKIQDKDEYHLERISTPHPYKDLKKLEVVSEYPYVEFKVVDEVGSMLISGKSAYFPETFYNQISNKDYLDYEVLYIGQSVSLTETVPVAKRTDPHSTLKNVLAKYSRLHPDKEVFLLFAAIKQGASLYVPKNRKKADAVKMAKGITNFYGHKTLSNIKQQITLCEACLINYFKPEYNDKFKQHPPSKKHKSFRDLSELNLSKVHITIDLGFPPRLFSKTIVRASKHVFEYEL